MRSEIIIKNMQIKSKEKLEQLAEALEKIEIECGIKEVKITLENIFFCPDVDIDIDAYDTPMEKLLINIILKTLKVKSK